MRRPRKHWFAFETGHRAEATARKSLVDLGFQSPLLAYRARPTSVRGQRVREILPIFEGYVLGRGVDASIARSAKGIRRLVGIAQNFEVDYLLGLVQSDGYVHLHDCEPPAFALAESVQAMTGAFRDQIGEYRGADPVNTRNALVCFQLMRREVVASIFRYDLALTGSLVRAV